ncbi:XisI protein [Leptolyngbya cf. ectocarpi LEGE 11479]|uniref:XisI protein n=1 Tax=Leptolyngbya cf. ectocarpi LEGE 11479 TaxID=1828722 RepID=A0A928ZZW3_LEPEC|nr:XisI protein [Leptolyngbya ectocarpi]MBE9070471.1 XisI protein [Leptolyngbya cf. ectocarpi LEGE 11479]
MDKLEKYRTVIRDVLTEYHQINQKAESTVESSLVFDDTHNHYLLILMGWNGDERIKTVMIHICLKDEKVWIEEDWTEDGVASDLLEKGLTKESIVLAFHPPQARQYTEFEAA